MVVYLVISGEAHEGGTVEGVFSTKEAADKYAEELTKERTYNDWIKTPTGWGSGCDSIDVEAHEVKGEPVKSEPVKTLRDEFAMAALNGLLSHNPLGYSAHRDARAKVSYGYADAMLKARKE